MTHTRNTQGLKRNYSKWQSTKETKAIRVPVTFADRLLEIAHALDQGEADPAPGSNQEAIMLRIPDAIAILKDALDLKANAGGKIKAQIKKALSLLEN